MMWPSLRSKPSHQCIVVAAWLLSFPALCRNRCHASSSPPSHERLTRVTVSAGAGMQNSMTVACPPPSSGISRSMRGKYGGCRGSCGTVPRTRETTDRTGICVRCCARPVTAAPSLSRRCRTRSTPWKQDENALRGASDSRNLRGRRGIQRWARCRTLIRVHASFAPGPASLVNCRHSSVLFRARGEAFTRCYLE